MACLDKEGEVIQCDRCKDVMDYRIEGVYEAKWPYVVHELWERVIFFNRHKPDFGDFCRRCANEVTPLVFRMRDIDELKLYTNRLERAIRERRTENNRATANPAGECGEGGAERRP